jgi:hypothetical protein
LTLAVANVKVEHMEKLDQNRSSLPVVAAVRWLEGVRASDDRSTDG